MEVSAVCHVHSVWSYDGSWSLQALRDKFSRHGCRVLMMTEHDRGFSAERLEQFRKACQELSNEKILVVPGIEYSDAANRVHVLVWGPVPFLGEGLPTSEMLAGAQANDGVAVLAHPARKEVWKSFRPDWADRLIGIEAWNRKYDGWAPSKAADTLLGSSGLVPFVGLDFHTQRQSFPLRMTLEIRSAVTEEAVIGSLRSRQCYAKAFGIPVGETLLQKALPALLVAERSRRTAASIVRHSRAWTH
jgi:hypothetical protein